MVVKKNIIINGKYQKPILIDIFYMENKCKKPMVIFCHGYKGFKDWGAWDLMANNFAIAGFCFLKFNFSYNGGTIEQPIDFPDLEAFGNNNYTKELDDLETVINWVCEHSELKKEADINNITLIGHSRGGGIVSIKAEEDTRIKKVISLAGVCDYVKRSATGGDLEVWKKTGVRYVLNGRTKQQMPHYYQFYEDLIVNKERLNIQRAVSSLKIPQLIIHGSNDTSISIDEAHKLHKWNTNSVLKIVEGANHVFDAYHPWDKGHLPKRLKIAIDAIIDFLK